MKKIKVRQQENGSVELLWQGMKFNIGGVENGIGIVMTKDRPVVLPSGHPNLLIVTGLDNIVTKAIVAAKKEL